jgi:hypothetical protein
MSEAESEPSVEAPKQRPKRVMSDKQKAAFQKAQEKRMANIENIRAKKQEVKTAEKVTKLTKKVAELKAVAPQEEPEESTSDTEIVIMPRKPKKKKRIVVVQAESESEEEEIVIQKPKAKPKAKPKEEAPVLKHSPTMPNMYFV